MESLFISQEPSSVTRISIENAIYYLNLNYSSREGAWYFSLADVNKRFIIEGVKLQWGVSPTSTLSSKSFSGNFYVIKNSNTSDPISRENLSQTGDYSLVYVTLDEEVLYGLVSI